MTSDKSNKSKTTTPKASDSKKKTKKVQADSVVAPEVEEVLPPEAPVIYFADRARQQSDETKETTPNVGSLSFEEIVRKNQEAKAKREQERKKNNENVLKSYRIK